MSAFVKPMRLGDVGGADSVIEGGDFGGITAKTVGMFLFGRTLILGGAVAGSPHFIPPGSALTMPLTTGSAGGGEVTGPGFLTLIATPGLVGGGGGMFAVAKEMGMGAVDGADFVAGGAETVEVPGPGFGTRVLTGVMRRRPQALWASEDFWLLLLLGV